MTEGAGDAPIVADRLLAWIETRRGLWVCCTLALLLSLPAIVWGFQSDDHTIAAFVREQGRVFTLLQLSAEDVTREREAGGFVWLTPPDYRHKLLRPLSSWTHWVDMTLWPDAAWLMHLVSSVLYVGLVAVAVLGYRALIPNARVAAIASLLYAIDDGHGPAVGWIASRSTLLTSLFSLLALLSYARARVRSSLPWYVLSTVFVVLALASGEAGVSSLAMLLAYALCLDTGNMNTRLLRLAPAGLVFVAWAAIYLGFGYGTHGGSWYRGLSDPGALLVQGLLDLPLWLLSLFGPSVVGFSLVAPQAAARAIGWLLCAPLLAAVVLGVSRTRENRFFALCLVLALPPLFTTVPQDRLLVPASFASSGLIASFLLAGRDSARGYVRVARPVFWIVHVALAPVLFVAMLGSTSTVQTGAQRLADAARPGSPREVVLLNTPLELFSFYARKLLGERSVTESLHQLYVGSAPLHVKRTDERTLELSVAEGWGRAPSERIFASVRNLPRPGSRVALRNLEVEVVEANASGLPTRVRFCFPDSLESGSRRFLRWQGKAPVPWKPIAVGESSTLPPAGVLDLL